MAVTVFYTAELFGIGYVRVAKMKAAVTVFQKTGKWPINGTY